MHTPAFWYRHSIIGHLLRPLGSLYNFIVQKRRQRHTPQKVSVPVICVGNVMMGGSGKTTVVATIVGLLKEHGYTPHILSRGYKAALKTTTLVEPTVHSSHEVGDEPLLLSASAPVWIGADRVQSAQAAINTGADILVMDDGFQNPQLYKDLSLLVFDGQQQLGNGLVFPAGPLRENLDQGLALSQGVILINFAETPAWAASLNTYTAKIIYKLTADDRPYLAFAGLGFPNKFFKGLKQNGFNVVAQQAFADHYCYTQADMEKLKLQAQQLGATLITTQKDYVKIPGPYKADSVVQEISLEIENTDAFINHILNHVKVDK